MIVKKTFNELSEIEKETLCSFIVKINPNKTVNAIEKFFTSIIFEKGNTLFCFWENDLPVATIGVVIKEIIYRGEVFITAINIEERHFEKFNLCYHLLESFLKEIKARNIKLGISKNLEKLIPYLEKLAFKNPYFLFDMSFLPTNKYEIDYKVVKLETLNNENKLLFRDINNSAFINCPNGGILSEEDINNFLDEYTENPDLIGLFYFNNEIVGTFELNLENDIGIISSISISPERQGKGLGKILLYSVINKLIDFNAKKIKLNVISTNTLAYEMYLKNGFTNDGILSYWFEKTLK